MAIYSRIKSGITEGELREENANFKNRNRALNVRIQGQVNQIEGFRVENDHLIWEKGQVVEERDRVIGERQELILNHAPVLIEKDRLQDENRDLTQQRDLARNQNAQLNLEKDAAVNNKRQMEGDYQNALQELGIIRAQLERVDDHRQLNQHLNRFHELYLQIEGGGAKGATQAALGELIPEYKIHRAKLHGMLRTAIDRLPANDLNRIPLNGILRLSEEEVDHVERISQTLHLIDELRGPLAEYFQAPPGQLEVGEVN